MTESQDDDAIPYVLDRRTLFRLGGGVVAAAAGIARTGRQDANAVQDANALGRGEETVEDLAARLFYDAESIYMFVRDEIAYEPYAGVLRGAQGTLRARAGNAADQALLLAELLTASAIPIRYAWAALDDSQAATLLAASAQDSVQVRQQYEMAASAAVLGGLRIDTADAIPPDLLAEGQRQRDVFQQASTGAIALAEGTLGISVAVITAALAEHDIVLPAVTAALPEAELTQHAWVQTADGGSWSDLDPSLPLVDGETRFPVETGDDLPSSWQHSVRITVEGERYRRGSLESAKAVTFTGASGSLAGAPIAIGMMPLEEFEAAGIAVADALAGRRSIYPWIFHGGDGAVARKPLLFSTGTDDGFGTPVSGIPEDETTAVRLILEITSPDRDPVRIVRSLLDRIAPEDRATGFFAPERLAPVGGIAADMPDSSDTLTLLHVEVARTPLESAVMRAAVDDTFGPLGTLGPSLSALRDTLGMEVEARSGTWSYPDAPNVTAFTIASGMGQPGGIASDLLYRHRRVLPLAGNVTEAAAHPEVLSGVLDAVAEQVLLSGGLPDHDGVTAGPAVGGLFTAAAEAGIPIRAIVDADGMAALDLDAESRQRIAAALDAGLIVVTPETPIELDGNPARGWWTIDPTTGQTRDQIQDGRAGASLWRSAQGATALYRQIGEYAHQMNMLEIWMQLFWQCSIGLLVSAVSLRIQVIAAILGHGSATGAVVAVGALGTLGVGTGLIIAGCA